MRSDLGRGMHTERVVRHRELKEQGIVDVLSSSIQRRTRRRRHLLEGAVRRAAVHLVATSISDLAQSHIKDRNFYVPLSTDVSHINRMAVDDFILSALGQLVPSVRYSIGSIFRTSTVEFT